MAVTLNVNDALVAARIVADATAIPAPVLAAGTLLHASASVEIDRYAPNAPAAVANVALVRMLAHLWELGAAANPRGYQSALHNSGATGSLAPYRSKRAAIIGDVTEAARAAGNPVTGVRLDGPDLVFTFADGVDLRITLPSNGGGGPGVDATARAAAAAAAAAAGRAMDAATMNAAAIGRLPLDGSVDTAALADDAVTAAKLADDSVSSRKIVARAITTALLADNAVDGAKIPSDAIQSRHIAADQVTGSEIAGGAVDTDELAADGVTEPKLAAAVRTKLNQRGTGSGDDAYDWATEGNTDLIPARKIPDFVSIVAATTVQAITAAVAGEKVGDIAIGYDNANLVVAEYTDTGWRIDATIPLAGEGGRGQTRAQINQLISNAVAGLLNAATGEMLIERIVSAWAIAGNADGIPGAKTYDGLFTSEDEDPIPAANVAVAFGQGTADDGDETDETDAAGTSFNITAEQANEAGGFLRVRYNLTRTEAAGPLPRDIELILQNPADGSAITKHNLKDEGAGTAQFAFGDAGRKRWAVRVVTVGRYVGTVTITEATFHSSEPRADAAIEHVVHPIVSDEAEKRQQQDAVLRADIARVEQIKAIVNGLPAATATRKGSIVWKTTPPYEQAVSDAFQVPATGFVQFILGNLGATPIMRAEDCANREMTGIYTFGRDNVGLEFDSQRRAIVVANRGGARSPLADDIAATTVGYVMLHWAPARAGGTPEPPAGGGLRLGSEVSTTVPKAPTSGGTVLSSAFVDTGAPVPTEGLLLVEIDYFVPQGAYQYLVAADRFSAITADTVGTVVNSGDTRGTHIELDDGGRYRLGKTAAGTILFARQSPTNREVTVRLRPLT